MFKFATQAELRFVGNSCLCDVNHWTNCLWCLSSPATAGSSYLSLPSHYMMTSETSCLNIQRIQARNDSLINCIKWIWGLSVISRPLWWLIWCLSINFAVVQQSEISSESCRRSFTKKIGEKLMHLTKCILRSQCKLHPTALTLQTLLRVCSL